MDFADLGMRVDSRGVVAATKHTDNLAASARRTGGVVESSLGRGARRAMLGVATAAGAAVAGLAGLVSSVSVLRDFESSAAQVQAITRATADEMGRMRDIAKELGSTTEFTAAQAMDGLRFLGMAGFEAAEAVASLPDVLDLATASGMSMASAADIASNIMSAYSVSAENAAEVTDALAAVASRANTDVFQLGDAMKYVGPVASSLSISTNKTAAAIGVLSDNGLQGAMAGTGLRKVLSSLVNPTNEAADALKSMGVSLEEVSPETNELVDIVDRLAEAGIGASEALTIFGDRGGPAILALTASNGRLRELTGIMSSVEGEASRMADTMRDNLGGDINSFTSAVQGLTLSLGEAGLTSVLRGVVQSATSIVRALTQMVDMFKRATDEVGFYLWELFGVAKGEEIAQRAIDNATMAMGDQIDQSKVLDAVMSRSNRMTLESARVHLAAAEARRRELEVMTQQARLAAMNEMGWTGLLYEIERVRSEIEELETVSLRAQEAGKNLPGLTADPASRAAELEHLQQQLAMLLTKQQEYKAVLDSLSYLPPERQTELDELNAQIKELQDGIDAASGGVVDFNKEQVEAITLSDRLSLLAQDIASGWDEAEGKASALRTVLSDMVNFAAALARGVERVVSLLPGRVQEGLGALKDSAIRLFKSVADNDAISKIVTNLQLRWEAINRMDLSTDSGGGGGQTDAEREHNRLLQEAQRIYESTRTEAEMYAIEVDNLNKLHKAGYIDTETYNRAIDELGQKYLNTGGAASFFRGQIQHLKDGILDALASGKSLVDTLGQIAEALARAAWEATLFGEGPLAGLFGTAPTDAGGGGGLFGWLGDALMGALPGHASGTDSAPGGMSLVGEEGPEIVNLPKGAQVVPFRETRQFMQQASKAASRPAQQLNPNVSVNVDLPPPRVEVVTMYDPERIREYNESAAGQREFRANMIRNRDAVNA